MFGAKKNHDDVWTELSTNIGNGFADDNDEDDGSPPWMLPKSLRKGNGDSDGLNMSDMDDDAELIGLGAFAKLLTFQVLSMLEYRKLIQRHAVHSIQHVLKVLKENSALKKFATKLLPFFCQHSRMISGDDVSALLEPGRDLGLDQSKRYLQKQKDYYNAPITLQGTAFTFFITFVDIGMMIAEIIVNNGLVPGFWLNVSVSTLETLGGKKTSLIQAGQLWRLITAMFLHVGFMHLIVNIMSQLMVGLQTERSLGFLRMMFIYVISGIGGNLLSAVFLPRILEVGASSSLFGLFGIYFVDLIVNWKLHPYRKIKLWTLIITTVISLAIGLLPMIDNFAHIGGFITGILSSMLVIPKLTIPPSSRKLKDQRRCMILTRIILALVLLLIYFGGLVFLLFSGIDMEKYCFACQWLSCLPIFESCRIQLGYPPSPVAPPGS